MWIAPGATGIIPQGNPPSGPSSFNAHNQLTTGTPTFDLVGNQTSMDGDALIYDAENRQIARVSPTNNSTVNYLYDGDGKRVARVEQVTSNGTTMVTAQTVYVYL